MTRFDVWCKKGGFVAAMGWLLMSRLAAQPFPDHCEQAFSLPPDGRITVWRNDSATATLSESPHIWPGTCIQSFENDGWFSFRTTPGMHYYEVTITPLDCNTPAGLQALVIESPGCDTAGYLYRACANPKSVSPLRMVFQESRPDIPFLVYVDGYDGTICQFEISVTPSVNLPDDTPGLKRGDVDYTQPDQVMPLESASAAFVNNEIEVQWSDPAGSEASYYLVERLYGNLEIRSGMAYVLARVDANSQVSTPTGGNYTFRERSPVAYGEEACYRIVQVNADASRVYFEKMCAPIQRIESFSIGVPLPDPNEPGIFLVQYTLINRQPLVFSLDNEGETQLKTFTLARNAPQSGFVTLNMRDYPLGTYWLKAKGKDGEFRRSFYWSPEQ